MLVPYILKVKKNSSKTSSLFLSKALCKNRGISSNGRAPASHAGSTGIDTRILQSFLYQYVIGYSFFTTNKLDFFSMQRVTSHRV